MFATGTQRASEAPANSWERSFKLRPASVEVKAAVGIGAKPEGGFGLKVDLIATLSGLSQADAETVVAAADTVCPYSNAVRGNMEVGISVRTA